jgi:hypothetical protein
MANPSRRTEKSFCLRKTDAEKEVCLQACEKCDRDLRGWKLVGCRQRAPNIPTCHDVSALPKENCRSAEVHCIATSHRKHCLRRCIEHRRKACRISVLSGARCLISNTSPIASVIPVTLTHSLPPLLPPLHR